MFYFCPKRVKKPGFAVILAVRLNPGGFAKSEDLPQ